MSERSLFPSAAATLVALAPSALAQAPDPIWVNQFGGPDHDFLYAAAPDGFGGSLILGGINSGGNTDLMISRVDVSGATIWQTTWDSGSTFDIGNGIAPDGDGGAFVAGYRRTGSTSSSNWDYDVFRLRLDSSGDLLWAYGLSTQFDDTATDCIADGEGGFYVVGESGPPLVPGTTSIGGFIARFQGSGALSWIRAVDGASGRTNAAALDGAGGVFVVGAVQGPSSGPTGLDSYIARFDAAGDQTWLVDFGGTSADFAEAVASDGAGGAYVGGSNAGHLFAPVAGNYDSYFARFDAAGVLQWGTQIGTAEHEFTSDLIVTGAGGLTAAGRTSGSLAGPHNGAQDGYLARFTPGGDLAWALQFGTDQSDSATALCRDGEGGFFVAGHTSGTMGSTNHGGADYLLMRYGAEAVGTVYCAPAQPNSTGGPATLAAVGSLVAADDALVLQAAQLPPDRFGHFLNSRDQGLVPQPGGSQGVLCLGGAIGRFNRPGEVQTSGPAGAFSLALDLTDVPTPTGGVSALAGETWNFQAWYRDQNPGQTSNFTAAVSIDLL